MDSIVQKPVEGFYRQGGIRLYQCSSTKNSLSMLTECIKNIPAQNKSLPKDKPWSAAVCSLHDYYHHQAPLIIETEWQQIDYSFLPEEQQKPSPRLSRRLRLGALMSLAHRIRVLWKNPQKCSA